MTSTTQTVSTLRVGQRITLAPGVTMRVLAIHGNFVKLGIDAPRSVPIYRAEIVGVRCYNRPEGTV